MYKKLKSPSSSSESESFRLMQRVKHSPTKYKYEIGNLTKVESPISKSPVPQKIDDLNHNFTFHPKQEYTAASAY